MEGRTLQSGRYTVGCQIGLGNYGVVYEGLDTRNRAKVAIKVLAPHVLANKELLDITLLEIDILKKINHPYIIKLLDNFEEGPNFFLVYNFCEKGDLKASIDSKGKMREEDALKLVFQCTQALCELNRHMIIHRDIKPENIFLTEDKCQLGDFGLCYVGPTGQLGASVGSLGFLAPETQKYQFYSPKADVYSLGICFYEMMHGDIPFTTPELDVLYQAKLSLRINLGPQSQLTPFGQNLMSRMVDPNESSRISCEEITQILTNRFSNSQQLLPNQGLQESRAAIQQEGNKDRKPSYLADQSRRGIKHQKASSQAVLPEYSRPPQFSNGFVTNQNQIGYPQRDSTQPWNAPHDQPTVVPQPAQPSLAIASNPQPQYLQPKVKPIYSVTKQQLTADLKTSEPQPAPKSYEQQYGNSVMDFAHRPAYNGPSQSYLHQPRDNPSRNTTLLNLQPSVQTIAFLNDQAKPLPAERNQTQLHYKEPDTPPVRTAPQPRSSTPSKNFISEKYLEKEVPVQQILELPKTQITEPKQEHHSSLSSYQKYMKHSSSTMELPSPSSYIDHNTSSHFGSSHTQNLSRINNNFVQMDKQAQVLMHAQPRSDQMDRNRFQMLDSSPPPSFLSRDQHSYRPQNYVKPLVSAPLKQSSDPRYSETLQQPVTRPSFQSITQPPIFHEPLKQYSADKNNSSPEYFRPKATQNVQKFIDETIFNVGGQSQMMTLQTSTNPPIQNAQPPSNQDGSRVPDLAIFSTDDYRDRDRKEYKKIVDMVAGTRDTSNWQQRHRKDQASIFATGWENDTIQLRTLESSAQEMPASVNHSFAAYQGTANVRPTMNSSFKHDASNDWSENQENPVPLKRPLARRSETTQGLFTDGRRSLPQQTKSTLGDRLSEASKKMESSTQSKGFQQRGLFNERRTSSSNRSSQRNSIDAGKLIENNSFMKHSNFMNRTTQLDASVTDPKSRKSVEPFWKPNLKNNLISASGSGQNDYFKTAMMKETGRQSNGGRTEESRGYSPLITAPSKTVRKNGELDNQRCANKQTNGGDSYRGLLKNEFNKYSMKLLISEYAPPPANGMPSPLKGKLGGTAGDQNKGRQESGRKEEKNEQQAVESKKDTNQKDGYSLAKLQSIVDRLPLDPRVKFGKREANGGQKAPHQVAQQVIKSEGQPTQHLNNMESRPSHSGQVKPTQKEQTSPLQNSPFRKTDSQVPSQSNHTAFHDNRGFKDGLNAQAVRTMH